MTEQYSYLDSVVHRQHGWKRRKGFRCAQKADFAPLLLAELAYALPIYPLAFTQHPDGKFQLVAVLSIEPGENLFVDAKGQWQAVYIPNHFRAYPFTILQVKTDTKKLYMVGFDQGSGLYRESPNLQQQEERFYDDAGQLTPWMQQLANFLGESAKNRMLTDTAVSALAAAKLFEPWEAPAGNADSASPPQTALYRINPTALKHMPGNVLEILRNTQALDIAYAQLFSMQNYGMLRQRHALRQPKPPIPASLPASLDSLFGEGQRETLSFDWLK